ncbi:MAG: serine/threonine-protein kinase, partial [Legionella sp.]|nr:serine/threonine-protein kinase [Legionella sp.]
PHLDQGKRKDIVKKLLAELSSIHQYGITHNDIKPKNLLYDPVSHSIHIIDFGCAEDVGNQIKYQYLETAKYAIEYMPPEYLEGVVSSPANDMYSLSLCIAEILGIDKFLLVQNRLERTLKDIHNEDFKTSILSAFNAAQSLDHALFAPLMDKFRNSDIFQQFINLYVNTAYDFLPFKDHLGDHMITLLDQLQNKDHVNRPDIAQCLEYMDNSSLIDVNNMTDKFEKK